MKVLLCLTVLLALASSQGPAKTPCPKCLHSIWFRSITLLANGTDRCATISLEDVMSCLDTCDRTPTDMPISYRIRQLTQICDIFNALKVGNCTGGGCGHMIDCVLSACNYEYEGHTGHAPYSTVFDYNCRTNVRAAAMSCLAASQCTTVSRLANLRSVLSLGLMEACDDPRRCVKYGNIFEVKPGSSCNEYYQEAAAYGPSMGIARDTPLDQGFDPYTCKTEYLINFTCPADPQTKQIYTEFKPPSTTPKPKPIVYEPISINTSLPCEQCLYPLWYRAVTTNGSHLCDPSFRSQVYECLANCQCCPGCAECPGRYEEHKTEVFVKLADISKAMDMNQCSQGIGGCSGASLNCTEHLARFYPIAAPHVTVNTFSCRKQDLEATMSCLAASCDSVTAGVITRTIIDGFDPICLSKTRCVSYGNIYEYVPLTEVDPTEANLVPCAHYRQAPVNGWYMPAGMNRVAQGYLFNMNGCYPDWPVNVNCPAEIRATDPATIG